MCPACARRRGGRGGGGGGGWGDGEAEALAWASPDRREAGLEPWFQLRDTRRASSRPAGYSAVGLRRPRQHRAGPPAQRIHDRRAIRARHRDDVQAPPSSAGNLTHADQEPSANSCRRSPNGGARSTRTPRSSSTCPRPPRWVVGQAARVRRRRDPHRDRASGIVALNSGPRPTAAAIGVGPARRHGRRWPCRNTPGPFNYLPYASQDRRTRCPCLRH